MKKTVALLLTLLLVLSLAAFTAAEEAAFSGTITIGDGSGISGDFGYDFGIAQPDVNMFMLITGYQLVPTDVEGNFHVNETAVKSLTATESANGSMLYDIVLNEGLVWTDGKPVTAYDYVASYLFRSTQAYADCGAYAEAGYHLTGYFDFYNGVTEAFAGVHLVSDYEFTVEVSPDDIPSYYQDYYIDVYPIRLDAWAPGYEIVETESGAKFNKAMTVEDIAESVEAERRHPTFCCGAYTLESFDEGTLTGVFKANPDFKGNYEGKTPTVETVIYKNTSTETEMDELRTGSIDVLLNATSADKINAGLDLTEEGGFYEIHYPGCGFSCIFFDCGKGATSSQSVRQAIVYSFDRVEFVKQMAGGFASVLNGYYPDAIFGAQGIGEELNEDMNPYSYDLNKATELLEADGWTLNKDGNPFVAGTDDVRYKQNEDGTLSELYVHMVASSDSKFSDLCVQMLSSALPQIGVHFETSQVDWGLLMQYMYDSTASDCNMYVSGSWFGVDYQPSWDYTLDPELMDSYNIYHVYDEELYSLARAIETTEPGDEETYLTNFYNFNMRWNSVLPAIPMYSGDTYCFINERIQGYVGSAFANPDYSILYCTVAG